MTALAVYVLAALTTAAYQSALAKAQRRARTGLFVTVLAAAMWPAVLPVFAYDWLASKRAARRKP